MQVLESKRYSNFVNSINSEKTKIEFTKEILDEIDKIKKGEPVPKTKIVTNRNGYSYEYTSNKRFSYEVGRKRLTL